MARDYPTADTSRCYDCGILPGRDHHYNCTSPAAKRQRREWEAEERRIMAEIAAEEAGATG